QLLVILLCIEYNARIKIATDTTLNGTWYIARKLEAMTPIVPNVDIRRKPIDEQLLHTPDMTPNADPENKDALLILILECLMTYTFILTSIPNRIETMVVRINPTIASSGR
ncbi:MAG: hypothetical protein WBX81_15830, partial [Nitrososphaeraceae archaeon]